MKILIPVSLSMLIRKWQHPSANLVFASKPLPEAIETVSPEGTFCDTVQVSSRGGDMELI